ncbi:MAG: O-antigen ligase family protein [Elusimicrobiota bacterium]|nr:O-antigen ligase family protein [Elusimicrobiota bacterium]
MLFALTAFGPLAFGCVEPWSRAALQIMAFALALACFLRGPRPVPPAASWFWLLPAGFAAFGLLQGLNPAAADLPRPAGPFTAAESATNSAALLWGAYAALLWSVPQVITTHRAARRYARLLLGLGAALAAQGVLQAATGGGRLYWVRATELTGTFASYYNRDHAANFFLMALAMGLGVVWSKRSWPQVDGPSPERVRELAGLGALAALILAGVLATGSRGALLVMPLTAMLVGFAGAGFVLDARVRRLRAAAFLAAASFVVFFCFQVVGASAEAGAQTDRAVTMRFFMYRDALPWLADSPLFGTGLGSFETVYPSYQDASLGGLAKHAHSDWLELALETGLPGLLAGLAGALLLAVVSVRAWLAAGSSEMRALIGGALGAAAAFALHALIDFPFQIPGNAAVFLGIVGFLLSSPQWADKTAPSVRAEPTPAWSAAAAAACAILLSVAAARSGEETEPQRLRRLGARALAAASAGDAPSPGILRAALAVSLEAAAQRPFDYRALELAGRVLTRLGRPADAYDYFERSRLVRFTPLVVGEGRDRAEAERRRTETLKSMGLLPRGFRER